MHIVEAFECSMTNACEEAELVSVLWWSTNDSEGIGR